MRRILLFIICCCCVLGNAYAQTGIKKQSPKTRESQPIELISAGELEMMLVEGIQTRFLRSKDSIPVVFRQGNMTFRCQQAIQFSDSNFVVAMGDIFVEDGDSIQARGDTLLYDGNSQFAELRSNVLFTDKHVVLKSPYVNYYVDQKIATYQYGAVITDEEATLTSRRGYYYTQQKLIAFKRDVVLDNPKADYHIKTDTLTYHTVRKVAIFHAQTFITSKNGNIEAWEGEYYTEEGRSRFSNKVSIENDSYIIHSDQLSYLELEESGEAKGRVRMFSKKDSLTIYGDESYFDEAKDQIRVFGQVLVEKPFGQDTLFLAADSLLSLTDSTGAKSLLAYPHVKIYAGQLEGVCDSLAYHTTDSLIEFFKNPVLWTGNSQLTADTLVAVLLENRIDRLRLRKNAFIASKDSLGLFDQIKGRNMLATFDSSHIKQVDVNGNGQSIYFALENEIILMGMNRVDCGSMIMRFARSNELDNITFIKKPDAKFVPPHELTNSDTRLPDFNWQEEKRPGLAFVRTHPFWKPAPPPVSDLRIIGDKPPSTPKPKSTKLDTMALSAQYGQLINDTHFLVFLDNQVLTFVHNGSGGGRFNETFYVDIIPKENIDLRTVDRKKGYEQRIKRPSASELVQKPFAIQLTLPNYPMYTIRFGQFTLDRDENQKYIWSEAYNLY